MTHYSEESSKELRELFELEVLHWPQVTTRRMFGCPSYQVEGRLFAFLVDEGIVLTQLRQAEREALGEHQLTAEFQTGDRPIQHWIQVTVVNKRDLGYVMPFVRKSYEIALARALEK